MCDANYCFTIVDIGAYGRQSDGGVLYNSNFGRALREGKLDIPSPSSLPHCTDVAPYVVAEDEAFPLLRPYPGRNLTQKQKVFNFRLSRARRIIENTFGIIATKWRILHRPILATPEKCESYIKAICCLHNFVKMDGASARAYCLSTLVDHEDHLGNFHPGEWRSQSTWQRTTQMGTNTSSQNARCIRDLFADYFVSEHGAVPWQDHAIKRTE